MKFIKSMLFALAAAVLVSASASAQTWTKQTDNDFIQVETARHTSSTTGAYRNVPMIRGNATWAISSSVAGITGTLTLATTDGSIISTSSVTLFTTPTIITVTGPLNFQKARLTLSAPGSATASETRVFSRQ